MNFRDKMIEYLHEDKKKAIYVPELDETIYFTPVTVLEMDKIMTMAQGNSAATHVWAVIEKAEDANGNKIFSAEDRPYVEKMPWTIITQITGEILRVAPVAELKKTSEATPSS